MGKIQKKTGKSNSLAGNTPEEGKFAKDAIKTYMRDISELSLLTPKDEIRLAGRIHGKNKKKREDAIKTLVEANLRLVVKIAHDFKSLGLPLSDLISEGNIGLMRAAGKFDPSKGAKFSSYSAWWIKQSMHRALGNQTKTIRIPVQSSNKMNKIHRMRAVLEDRLGREPSDAEIALALNCSERTVCTLRRSGNTVFSLNDPIQTGENGSFEDIIPDTRAKSPEILLSENDSIRRLHELLDSVLDERERMIVQMRFFGGKTLEEVSKKVGRTRERVRQIENQALSKLREKMTDGENVAYA